MKLTKYEHACFTVEQDGQTLIVDPGEYTTDFIIPNNAIAVIITHEHADHLSRDHLQAITKANPDVIIIGHDDVIGQLSEFATKPVIANEGIKIGPFALEFFGGQHAVIDPSIPVIANLGIMINDTLYYPGDSFTIPEQPVKVLALPVSAPWMKLSEAVDFVKTVKPTMIFPTHDAILSDAGKGLPDRMIPSLVPDGDMTYQRLESPIEI